MRFKGKVDKIQKDVVQELRQCGAHVCVLSDAGMGRPDLIVGFRGTLMWMEVKSPGGKLTQREEEFYSEWLEYMVVVHSVKDALKAIGVI